MAAGVAVLLLFLSARAAALERGVPIVHNFTPKDCGAASRDAVAIFASSDASADVYSLGVILYRMLTGKRLFQGQSRMDVVEAIRLHLSASPQPLASLVPDVAEAVAELVMAAMATEAAERPTSREMAERLRALPAGMQGRRPR